MKSKENVLRVWHGLRSVRVVTAVLALVAMCAPILVLVTCVPHIDLMQNWLTPVLLIAPYGVILVIIVYSLLVAPLLWRTLACPSCGQRLARVLRGIRKKQAKLLRFCPFCGASLADKEEGNAQQEDGQIPSETAVSDGSSS